MQDERNGTAGALAADQDERGSPDAAVGERLTVSVPEAARLLSISRSGAYEAAHRGELPVLRIGRRMIVPVKALRQMLDEVCGHPSPQA